MRTALKFLIVPLFIVALVAMDASLADARRFGGGRSFGGSRSFSKSYSKPVTPQRQTMGGASATRNTRNSRFGGMGGLFGGLLAGTLLGSLFFGHPFAGGGMMDILLIGGLIFLFMKLFRGRRPSPQAAAGRSGGMSYGGGGPQPQQDVHQRSSNAGWGGLGSTSGAAEAAPGIDVPAGFDTDEFLEGAKLAFNRLQASWDARDIDDIAEFTTTAVQQEIRRQAAEDPSPSRTEILMVNARLLEAKTEGGATLATVYFDALMREDAAGGTEQVREVWHFKKDDSVKGGMWLLDGLQQLAN